MLKLALVSVCLACTCQGRRVESSARSLQSAHLAVHTRTGSQTFAEVKRADAGSSALHKYTYPLQAFATFLFGLNPTVAYQTSSVRVPTGHAACSYLGFVPAVAYHGPGMRVTTGRSTRNRVHRKRGSCLMSTSLEVVPAPPRTLGSLEGDAYALGFDFGTSGVRCCVVDARGQVVASPGGYAWSTAGERQQEANDWVSALHAQLDALPAEVRKRVTRIAVSGTSSSMLLVDGDTSEPAKNRGRPRMYDFSVKKQASGASGEDALALISACAPEGHTVRSATSTLAKLLAYHYESPLAPGEMLAHQADFVASKLTGGMLASDWHNALKLGYDVKSLKYPDWMTSGPIGEIILGRLPSVVRPGEPIGQVSPEILERWGFADDCTVVGGTTDSIAAFIAAGACDVGDAVTSLGSTVAIKLLSSCAVDDASRGVYSHRLGDRWLVGGASNAGCAVLREQSFDAEELKTLSDQIDPDSLPPHDNYYPLSGNTVGERFPRPDDSAVGVLTPVPDERSAFLHCILHGISKVEAEGYAVLAELGADKLKRVLTSGGGAQNPTWTAMRQRMLGVPTSRADSIDAAYGASLLAAQGT